MKMVLLFCRDIVRLLRPNIWGFGTSVIRTTSIPLSKCKNYNNKNAPATVLDSDPIAVGPRTNTHATIDSVSARTNARKSRIHDNTHMLHTHTCTQRRSPIKGLSMVISTSLSKSEFTNKVKLPSEILVTTKFPAIIHRAHLNSSSQKVI